MTASIWAHLLGSAGSNEAKAAAKWPDSNPARVECIALKNQIKKGQEHYATQSQETFRGQVKVFWLTLVVGGHRWREWRPVRVRARVRQACWWQCCGYG